VFAEAQDDDDDDPFYLINNELVEDIAATRQDEDIEVKKQEVDDVDEESD